MQIYKIFQTLMEMIVKLLASFSLITPYKLPEYSLNAG